MHTNTNGSTGKSFNYKLADFYASCSEQFSELKHEALALWLSEIIKALESQNFSLDEIIFASSEVLYKRGFKEASALLDNASASILQQSRKNKNNGRD